LESTDQIKNLKALFFLAIVPDESVGASVIEIKQEFAEEYDSTAALKSPPHITIIPPFHYELSQKTDLEEELTKFCNGFQSFHLKLNGFGAFVPRVIYIKIDQNEQLFALFRSINQHFEDTLGIVSKRRKGRQFSPHMTVAFSDLSKEMFFKAWKIYKRKEVSFEFDVNDIKLLQHNGRIWEIVHFAQLIKLTSSESH